MTIANCHSANEYLFKPFTLKKMLHFQINYLHFESILYY